MIKVTKRIIFYILLTTVLLSFTIVNFAFAQTTIPGWIKSIAQWWKDGKISDKEVIGALVYLIETNSIDFRGIMNADINLQSSQLTTSGEDKTIPTWVKDVFGSWGDGKDSDSEVVGALQFLIQRDIVSSPKISELKNSLGKALDPHTLETAFITNTWNEAAMGSLLEMKNYEAKVLDDASDKLWQDYAKNKDKILMLKAEKVQKAANMAKDDALKVVKVLKNIKLNSDMLKNRAKFVGIEPTDLQKAAADPLAKFRQAKINSMNEFLTAQKRAHMASEQASIELKGVLGNLGYDQSKIPSYNGMGSVIRYDDPDFLSTSSVITPEIGGAISSSDGKLMIKFLPGAVTQPTKVSVKILPQGSWSKEISSGKPLGSVYRVEPSGLQLAKPAIVQWKLDKKDLAGINLEEGVPALEASTFGKEGSDVLDSKTSLSVGKDEIIITSLTKHFSDFVVETKSDVMLSARLVPLDVTVNVGEDWDVGVLIKLKTSNPQNYLMKILYFGYAPGVFPMSPGGPIPSSMEQLKENKFYCQVAGKWPFYAVVSASLKSDIQSPNVQEVKVKGTVDCKSASKGIFVTNTVGDDDAYTASLPTVTYTVDMPSDYGTVPVGAFFSNSIKVTPLVPERFQVAVKLSFEAVQVTYKVKSGDIELYTPDPFIPVDYSGKGSGTHIWRCMGPGPAEFEAQMNIRTSYHKPRDLGVPRVIFDWVKDGYYPSTKTATVKCGEERYVDMPSLTSQDPGVLTIQKEVINNNGGTKTPEDFKIKMNLKNEYGNPIKSLDPQNEKGYAGSQKGNSYDFENPVGYEVYEDPMPDYTLKYKMGDCKGTIGPGDQKECILVNDDNPSTTNNFSYTIEDEAVLVIYNDALNELISRYRPPPIDSVDLFLFPAVFDSPEFDLDLDSLPIIGDIVGEDSFGPITKSLLDRDLLEAYGMLAQDDFPSDLEIPQSEEKPKQSELVTQPDTSQSQVPASHEIIFTPQAHEQGCENTNFCVDPTDLYIFSGDTVKWINKDSETHTVVSQDPSNPIQLVSGNIVPGGTYSFTFTGDENFMYYTCQIHPWILGYIIVSPQPTPPPSQPTPQTPTSSQTTITPTISVISDPAGHAPFIGLSVSKLTIIVSGNTITISGSPPWVNLSGTIASGEFTATGSGTVADFANIPATMSGAFVNGKLDSVLTIGGGKLPTGKDITYSVKG